MRKLAIVSLIIMVSITFSCDLNEPEEIINNAPIIQSISITPKSTTPGTSVQVTSVVTDEEGDQIFYTWSIDNGTLSNSTGSSTTWEIPGDIKPGYNEYIKLVVTDGEKTTQQSKSLKIDYGKNVAGNLYYKDTKIPISDATVSIGTITSVSSEDGFFELENIGEGQQEIVIIKNGFDDFEQTIEIAGNVDGLEFFLTSSELTKMVYGNFKAGNDNYISNIKITLLNPDGSESDISTTSDGSGYYQLTSVPTGSRIIKIENENNNYTVANYNLEQEIFITSSDYKYDPKIYIEKTYEIDLTNSNNWVSITSGAYELQSDYLNLLNNCTLVIHLIDMPVDFLPSDYTGTKRMRYIISGTNFSNDLGQMQLFANGSSLGSISIFGYDTYIYCSNYNLDIGGKEITAELYGISSGWQIKKISFSIYY